MEPASRPKRGLRLGVVALLMLAAFLTAVPWLDCAGKAVTRVIDLSFLRACTFGFPNPPGLADAPSYLPGFTGPYCGSLTVGIVYLIAAFYVAFTKRSL